MTLTEVLLRQVLFATHMSPRRDGKAVLYSWSVQSHCKVLRYLLGTPTLWRKWVSAEFSSAVGRPSVFEDCHEFPHAQQLWIKHDINAVTCFRWSLSDILSKSDAMTWLISRSEVIFFQYSCMSLSSGVVGRFGLLSHRQLESFHHIRWFMKSFGDNTLEAESAGL